MNSNDVVVFDISRDNLMHAVDKALHMDFIDNLRERNAFVKLDSKIRGYLGEFLILDIIRDSNAEIEIEGTWISEEDDTDTDILIANANHDHLKIEVKTSLIPDSWNSLEKVVQEADIKIIKRESDYRNINSDFHVQIYFNLLTRQRDNYLKSIPGEISDYSTDELIDVMRLNTLRHAFVAWIDKNTLISHLGNLPDYRRTWHFSYRYFWSCKIRDAKTFEDFIPELVLYRKEY